MNLTLINIPRTIFATFVLVLATALSACDYPPDSACIPTDKAPFVFQNILIKPRFLKDGQLVALQDAKIHIEAVDENEVSLAQTLPIISEAFKVPGQSDWPLQYESGVAWAEVQNNVIDADAHLVDLSAIVDGQSVDGVIFDHKFYGSCGSTVLLEVEFNLNVPEQPELGKLSDYFDLSEI